MKKRLMLSLLMTFSLLTVAISSVSAACDTDNDGDRYYVEDNPGDCKGKLGVRGVEPAKCDGEKNTGLIDCTSSPGDEVCNADIVDGTPMDLGDDDDVLIDGKKIYPGAIEIINNGIDEDCDGKDGDYMMGSGKSGNLNDYIQKVINILSGLVASVSTGVLIWGGIMFATAAGNDDKIRKAKKTMIGAVIGLLVAISAWTIIGYVVANFMV